MGAKKKDKSGKQSEQLGGQRSQVDTKDKVKLMGVILKVLPGSEYEVDVDFGGSTHKLLGYISGRMRKNYIKLSQGDPVEVEVSPYDIGRCRIVYRHRPGYVPPKPVSEDEEDEQVADKESTDDVADKTNNKKDEESN